VAEQEDDDECDEFPEERLADPERHGPDAVDERDSNRQRDQ